MRRSTHYKSRPGDAQPLGTIKTMVKEQQFSVVVCSDGMFYCEIDNDSYGANSLDGLRTKVSSHISSTRPLNIHFIYRPSDDDEPLTAIMTSIHGGTGNIIFKDSKGETHQVYRSRVLKKEPDSYEYRWDGQGDNAYLKPTTDLNKLKELADARERTEKALHAFLKRNRLILTPEDLNLKEQDQE